MSATRLCDVVVSIIIHYPGMSFLVTFVVFLSLFFIFEIVVHSYLCVVVTQREGVGGSEVALLATGFVMEEGERESNVLMNANITASKGKKDNKTDPLGATHPHPTE